MSGEAMAAGGADLAVVIDWLDWGCVLLSTTLWEIDAHLRCKVGVERVGAAGEHG